MLHWCDSGLYIRSVCALMRSFLSGVETSNSSKFALLSSSFLWFEMPLYSTQTFEPFRRSGSRGTCAFQSPIKKSNSCDPSRCVAIVAVGEAAPGEAEPCEFWDCVNA